MFLLRLCAYLATKVMETDADSDLDKLTFGTMLTAHIFQKVTSRNDGFGEFGAIGSFHAKSQDYFLDLIWDTIKLLYVFQISGLQSLLATPISRQRNSGRS